MNNPSPPNERQSGPLENLSQRIPERIGDLNVNTNHQNLAMSLHASEPEINNEQFIDKVINKFSKNNKKQKDKRFSSQMLNKTRQKKRI